MHEWSLCAELVRQAEAEARRHGAIRVTAVKLVAGTVTGVVPEILVHAYAFVRIGTLLESAPLAVEIEPMSGRCEACKCTIEVERFEVLCPRCDGPLQLSGGEGLTIKSLELEVPDDAGEVTTDV